MNSGHVYAMNAPPSRRNRRTPAVAAVTNFYDEFSPLGSVTTPEEQERQRERQGYCTTCQQNPIKLFDIKKNKLNPLRRTKEPRTVEGQSFNGQCLVCYPHLDPNRRKSSSGRHRSGRGISSSLRNNESSRSSNRVAAVEPSDSSGQSPSQSPVDSSSRRNIRSGGDGCPPPESSPRDSLRSSSEMQSSSRRPLHQESSPAGSSRQSHGSRTPPPPSPRQPSGILRTPSSRTPPPPPPIGHSPADNRRPQRTPSSTRNQSIRFSEAMQQEDLVMPLPVEPDVPHNESVSDVLHFSGSTLSTSSSSFNYAPSRSVRFSQQGQQSLNNMNYNQSRENHEPRHDSCPNMGREERSDGRPVVAPTFSARTCQSESESSVARSPRSSNPADGRGHATSPPPSPCVGQDDAEVVELKVLLKDLGGNVECTADVLANAIRTNPDSEPLQIFFLESLCSVCKHNEENKSFFISMGLHEDVLNTMEKKLDNARIQELGCGAIWTLGVNERNRRFLSKSGAAASVFRALEHHQSQEKVAKTAVSALRTLSPEQDIQQELAQYHCATKVAQVMALHTSVVDLQRDGCAFLSNASIDMDTKTVSVVPYEEMKAVVRAIGYHTKNDKVTASACFALKNYTYEEENLRTMRRFGDLKRMLRDVSNFANSNDSREDALDILECLELSERLDASLENVVYNSFHDAMEGPDAVSNVMGIIKEYEWSPKLTSDGLDSLLTLAERSDGHRRKVTESHVLEEVVGCMNRHESNADIQQRCCNVLCVVAFDSRGRAAVCRTEACTSILNAMRECSHEERVQVAAVKVLAAIASDVQFASEQEENEMMAAMQESLEQYPDTAELQRVGADVVTALSTRWT